MTYPEATFVDGDGQSEEVRRQIESTLNDAGLPEDGELDVIVVEPDLETALGLVARRRPVPLETVIRQVDFGSHATSDPDLRRLLETLGIATDEHG